MTSKDDRQRRQRRAARLRGKGLSLRQIGRRLKVSAATAMRDLRAWDARQQEAFHLASQNPHLRDSRDETPGRAARPVDVVVPGSYRLEERPLAWAWVTVRCGACGHEQTAHADSRTSTCKRCGRRMTLAPAVPAAGNVTPLRRRS